MARKILDSSQPLIFFIVGAEVVVDHDLATEPPEHPLWPIVAVGHEPRNRTAGSSDHDLFTGLGSLEQLRQVGLRVVDVDASASWTKSS